MQFSNGGACHLCWGNGDRFCSSFTVHLLAVSVARLLVLLRIVLRAGIVDWVGHQYRIYIVRRHAFSRFYFFSLGVLLVVGFAWMGLGIISMRLVGPTC